MIESLASKPNKISAKTSASENLRFTKPSISRLSDVIQELKLSSDQVHELSLVMQHIEEDLDFAIGVIKKLPPRSTLTRRLKNLEKVIHILKDELKRGEKDLDHFLPHDLGSFIGKAMSLAAINHALGKDMFPRHVDLAISTSFVNGQPIDQRQIEKLQEPKREALGLKHSGILLTYLINGIYEPLRLWVELDCLNKGGRTPNMRRRYIIYWLAYYSPEILGRPAPASITGSFVRLCEAIFLACEFHVDGLEKVIPAIVKQARADRKNRDETEADQMARLQNLLPKP
jgi:hypothetical protein